MMIRSFVCAVALILPGFAARADDAAQANNPLANLTAFNVQNYYIPSLSGTDETANNLFFRYAKPIPSPIGPWLVRATLPVSRVPTGTNTSKSGLGDSNVFATYLIETSNPAVSLGVGPIVGIPTATDNALGTDQWSLGGAVVFFDARSKVVQWGGLVTYQHKVGGSNRVADINTLAVQPFGFVQLGKGYYLRAAPIAVFNLESGDFHIPIGIGVGKVVKLGNTVLNLFFEPQFTVANSGPAQPLVQIYAGVNMQFY